MKIVELVIDELEEIFGFDAVALVNQPAIEAEFHAFNSEDVDDAIAYQVIKKAVFDQVRENFVTKLPGESKDDYMARCIPVLRREGYGQEQSIAICATEYDSFELDPSALPDFIDEIGDKKKIEFESYTDYPESATNAAKRALEWRDNHPDQDCGTRVGWARANQLANREPISEETIARMASFARHLQYEDVPYSEGCGGLMVDAWGGRAGIEWASNKLDEIREEQSSQKNPYFDNLPDDVQDKLIETLAELGFPVKDLEEDYVILDEPQKFALPTRNSAKPNEPTNDTSGQYKILYEYVGPRDNKNRSFCRRLLDLNMMFRKEDIDKMTLNGANSQEFGFYDIFTYKGSHNCRHSWRKKYIYQRKGAGLLEVAALLLDQQAQMKENINNPQQVETFSKHFKFSFQEDQQIVVGPLMIPNKLIFRVDENGEPYYVYFTEETISKIARKMMEEKKLDDINIEHDQTSTVDGYMLETWLVEDSQKDKQQVYGMNFDKGTWMGMYKVEDPAVWQKVKNGELRGFSIEGFFADRLVQR